MNVLFLFSLANVVCRRISSNVCNKTISWYWPLFLHIFHIKNFHIKIWQAHCDIVKKWYHPVFQSPNGRLLIASKRSALSVYGHSPNEASSIETVNYPDKALEICRQISLLNLRGFETVFSEGQSSVFHQDHAISLKKLLPDDISIKLSAVSSSFIELSLKKFSYAA